MTFYFAWVNAADAFDEDIHSVEDEKIVSLKIAHAEGGFAMLSINIKNPRTNLIGPGRKLWAWVSQDGTPLFKGRLVAIPEEIDKELTLINFIARASDFNATKVALAETLKVTPFWDPIWIDEQRVEDDPDVVLEARAALWHIDRVTHAVSVSSITAGEDGAVTFDHFYDSLRIKYGSTPLRKVKVKATVQWDQVARGNLDFAPRLCQAFVDHGTPLVSGMAQIVSSYTGQGLQTDWPEAGDDANGGWSTGKAWFLQRIDGVSRSTRHKNVNILNDSSGDPLEVPAIAQFFIWEFRPIAPMHYDVSRQRIETITFALESDVQPLVTDPGEDAVDLITISSRAVGEKLDPHGEDPPPIEDLRRRSYLMTDRGLQSFEYLLMLARAKLLARARAVEITFQVPFADGIDLSCRQDGILNDPRLPAGTAQGKIVSYQLVAGGDGKQFCEVTIGCTIGEGETVTADPGDPTYVEDGYMDDTQQYENATISVGDITYEDYRDTPIEDDGIDFMTLTPAKVITNLEVFNGEDEQSDVIGHDFTDIQAAVEALNATFTEVLLELITLEGGPFQTDFDVEVSKLMIPKTLEL